MLVLALGAGLAARITTRAVVVAVSVLTAVVTRVVAAVVLSIRWTLVVIVVVGLGLLFVVHRLRRVVGAIFVVVLVAGFITSGVALVSAVARRRVIRGSSCVGSETAAVLAVLVSATAVVVRVRRAVSVTILVTAAAVDLLSVWGRNTAGIDGSSLVRSSVSVSIGISDVGRSAAELYAAAILAVVSVSRVEVSISILVV